MSKAEDLRATTPERSVSPEHSASPDRSDCPPAPQAAPPHSSKLSRTVHALRATLPFLQRLLPLLDGNIATTVANVLTAQPARPAPPVDLAPVEQSVTRLQTQNRELRDQVADQNQALKRLEQRLEAVREATDRSTQEQQEIVVSLKNTGKKLRIFAFAALALLIVSMLLDLALYIQMERALR